MHIGIWYESIDRLNLITKLALISRVCQGSDPNAEQSTT